MAKKPETIFKEAAHRDLRALQKRGHLIWFEKVQQVGIRGTPDDWLSVAGFAVALELKSGNEKPDILQQYKLERFYLSGGIALPVVTRENWDNIFVMLSELSAPRATDEARVLVRQRLRIFALEQFASLPSLLCNEIQEIVSHRPVMLRSRRRKEPR